MCCFLDVQLVCDGEDEGMIGLYRLIWLSDEAFASVVSDMPVVQLDMQECRTGMGLLQQLASDCGSRYIDEAESGHLEIKEREEKRKEYEVWGN